MVSIEVASKAVNLLRGNDNVVNVLSITERDKKVDVIYFIFDTRKNFIQKRHGIVNIATNTILKHVVLHNCPECEISSYGIQPQKIE